MRLSTVTVRYTIKNDSGFLVDLSKTFEYHKDAIDFLCELKRYKLVGKAILEIGEKR